MPKLPDIFLSETRVLLGDRLFGSFMEAMDNEAPVSIRLNPFKPSGKEDLLRRLEISSEVPWCKDGFYLSRRPQFTFEPWFHAGKFYVQEASSMFISHVLTSWTEQKGSDKPLTVLDLCAAPGGKSTAAISSLPKGSIVVANEPIRQRASVLAENMCKWGNSYSMVTCAKPSEWAASGLLFDVVICDVPCSGEGMFRKDPDSISEWNPQSPGRHQKLQKEIVDEGWKCLREGGLMIYSTCTLNSTENEDVINYMLCRYPSSLLRVSCPESWRIIGSLGSHDLEGVYRFIPGMAKGEGLFMASLIKGGKSDNSSSAPKSGINTLYKGKTRNNPRYSGSGRQVKADISPWIESPEEFDVFSVKNSLVAIPKSMTSLFVDASDCLNVILAGIEIGRIGREGLEPSHALSMSSALKRGSFPETNLSLSDSIDYLRRYCLTLPPSVPKGFVLACNDGVPMGWLKNVGPRANNSYPLEWRIKSQYNHDIQ